MPEPLSVALVWHMHQPYYREDGSGRFLLPWVRLRASKDYIRMIETAMRHPGLRIAMNFVPTLLEQLDVYAHGDFDDAHRELCLRPASALSGGERAFLVHFTRSADYPRRVAMFDPFYRLLAALPEDGAAAGDAEARDLQVWAQLVWLDPADIERSDELRSLVRQGAGFCERDKQTVDEHQLARVREVLPALREAIGSGCVEPMTSPFAHPILPLLIDQASALVARPDLQLPPPDSRLRKPDDAAAQLELAFSVFEALGGGRPAAVWPSECAVSPAAAALLARAGAGWAISDEGVLARSLGTQVRGDAEAMARLYAPYRERSGLCMVFRDALLSNKIGFDYASMPAHEAVDDLIGRLEEIAAAKPPGESWLVVIALDGENCWDYYENNGTTFLDGVYSGLLNDPVLRSVHVSEFVGHHPESVRTLGDLWSGSWIDADFSTWIGEDAQTRAWELLAGSRRALDRAGGPGAYPDAFRQILIAEGSDWFWWFGSRHQSGVDAAWDALYRSHLRSAYELMEQAPPVALDAPILPVAIGSGDVAPLRAIDPERSGSAEWRAAGVLPVTGVFGAMQPARSGVDRLFYGASAERLHLRIGDATSAFDRAEVSVSGRVLRLDGSSSTIAVPISPDQPASLAVVLREAGRGEERIPATGTVVVPRLEASPAAIIAVECAPLAVAGELADRVRGTVDALIRRGRTCVVVVPHHRGLEHFVSATRVERLEVGIGVQKRSVRLHQGSLDNGAIVLSIDEPSLFDRDAIYGEEDDLARYVFFARAAADVLEAVALRPRSVHGFEWQTAVTVALLSRSGRPRPATIFSAGPSRVLQHAPPGLLAATGLEGLSGADSDLLDLGERSADVVTAAEGSPLDAIYSAGSTPASQR